MTKIIVLIAIACMAAFGYPILNEEADSTCHALVKKALALMINDKSNRNPRDAALADNPFVALLALSLGKISGGNIANALIKEKYPNVPPFAGCAIGYWDLLLHPEGIQQYQSLLR